MLRCTLMLVLLAIALSGCFFSVKEMIVDPDKGITHTEDKENGIPKIQAKR